MSKMKHFTVFMQLQDIHYIFLCATYALGTSLAISDPSSSPVRQVLPSLEEGHGLILGSMGKQIRHGAKSCCLHSLPLFM